jgi:hypothetical protein
MVKPLRYFMHLFGMRFWRRQEIEYAGEWARHMLESFDTFELKDKIKEALNGPLEDYWCKDCKLPVYRDHSHWRSMIKIEDAPEADAYENLYKKISKIIEEYENAKIHTQ